MVSDDPILHAAKICYQLIYVLCSIHHFYLISVYNNLKKNDKLHLNSDLFYVL